jgi:diguanylate cyclase (GGDEF)-like protein
LQHTATPDTLLKTKELWSCPLADGWISRTLFELSVARRLRTRIAAHEIEVDETKLSCTVSLGVAALEDDIADPADLLRRADRALYAAKDRGRDRVVAASSLS